MHTDKKIFVSLPLTDIQGLSKKSSLFLVEKSKKQTFWSRKESTEVGGREGNDEGVFLCEIEREREKGREGEVDEVRREGVVEKREGGEERDEPHLVEGLQWNEEGLLGVGSGATCFMTVVLHSAVTARRGC